MFSIGDTVFYSAQGICSIEEIKEQKFGKESQLYYTLRSHHNPNLTLYHPVNTVDSKLKRLMTKEQAVSVLDCFKSMADPWDEKTNVRSHTYQATISSEDHLKIAQMANTLLRRRTELETIEKKLPVQDAQVLQRVTAILYEELATALDTTASDISEQIGEIIQKN